MTANYRQHAEGLEKIKSGGQSEAARLPAQDKLAGKVKRIWEPVIQEFEKSENGSTD